MPEPVPRPTVGLRAPRERARSITRAEALELRTSERAVEAVVGGT